jgi:hypothetical protein
MDGFSLSTLTLGEVNKTHILALNCGKCSRTTVMDLQGPHSKLGDAFRVKDLALGLKCLCGQQPGGLSLLPIHIVDLMFPNRAGVGYEGAPSNDL